MTKKTWPPKKTLKKCFFCFFIIINYVLKKKERYFSWYGGQGIQFAQERLKSHLQPPHTAHSVALFVGTGPTGGYFVSWLLRPSFYVSMTFAVNKRHLSFVKFNDYNKNPLDNHIAILHCWYCYRVKIIIPVPVAT